MSLGACLGVWLKKTLMDLAADTVAVPLTAGFLLLEVEGGCVKEGQSLRCDVLS